MLYKIVAVLVVTLSSTSVKAATYIGELEGIMTSGYADYAGLSDFGTPNEDYVSYELTGLPVYITFSFNDDFSEKYDVDGGFSYIHDVNVSGAIQFPPESDPRVANGSNLTHASDFWGAGPFYEGDWRSAHIVASGNVDRFSNHFAEFDIAFSGANKSFGPLQGGGRFIYSWGWGGHTQGIGNFVLTAGRVSASAVPEPSTWAMMLTGFGALGAMARRRGRNRVAYT